MNAVKRILRFCLFVLAQGKVLQVRMESVDATNHTVTYQDPETHDMVTVPVTGGHCKLQWKIDWPMRWRVFDVDFENVWEGPD